MINATVFTGRITKDLEIRKTGSGKSVLNFTLAVNRAFKSQGQPDADFITMIAWDKTADTMAQYLNKGSLIGVEGRLQTGSYEDKDGKTVYTTDIVVNNFTFLESKQESQSNQQAYTPQANNTQPRQQTKQEPVLDIKDTDLPF